MSIMICEKCGSFTDTDYHCGIYARETYNFFCDSCAEDLISMPFYKAAISHYALTVLFRKDEQNSTHCST